MDIEKILKELTFEEKAKLLTGAQSMTTFGIDRLGVKAVDFADGPHGVRHDIEENCTHFPNLCNLGSSWDVDAAEAMGEGIADDCIEHGVSMILGPGINIKRNILCGRNFEYFSEDPVLAGELAAGYIRGVQKKGVSACLKHFAVNSQEEYRCQASAEVDERTLREIYLRGFEIAVEKSNPDSVMCSYNKVNGIWASENEFLLKDVLKGEWGYEGMVVSDWGAVQDISRSVKAGLDLQMPANTDIVEQLKDGLNKGLVSMEDIDDAARRVLRFLDRKECKVGYNRDKQHALAEKIASAGMVLLKNDDNTLPLTSEKYKKIAVVGEFAVSPLIAGQGSAEVLQQPEYTDNPFDELKKRLPDVQFDYFEMYQKRSFPANMLWPMGWEFMKKMKEYDLVLLFAGAMESEDTEKFDRRTAHLNPNYEMFIDYAVDSGTKVAVVLQSGGALILGDWNKKVGAVTQMWLAGEAAGGAVADVLCGIVNPSGKLSETFPNKMRTDLEYPGDGLKIEYKERFDVGYRYYDKHTDEILYPFGHGLSYTTFEYSNLVVELSDGEATVTFTVKNTGDCDGAEVCQLYVGDPVTTVVKPIKELKAFKKVYLAAGESEKVEFKLNKRSFAYYNIMMRKWVVEDGVYDIYIGASSQDIRLTESVKYDFDKPYSIQQSGGDMLG